MAIIIKNKGITKSLNKENFDKENYLQDLISKNPESIPIYDIEEDRKLLIINREYKTNSGPIDAVGIDNVGNLYIIETKLYKNPDKRNVVAQALDYGSSLWADTVDGEKFLAVSNDFLVKNLKKTLDESIKEKFEVDDAGEVESIKATVLKNLNNGNLKFVALMNKLDERLKDLILYINENSKFDIYAVELEYYRHETLEILIPKIYGAEVKKDIQVAESKKPLWDKEKLLNKISENNGIECMNVAKKIIDFCEKNDIDGNYSQSLVGSFFIAYEVGGKVFWPLKISGEGRIGWNFPHQGVEHSLSPFNKEKNVKMILSKLSEIKGIEVLDDINKYKALHLPLNRLVDSKELNKFFDILLWIKEEVGQKN